MKIYLVHFKKPSRESQMLAVQSLLRKLTEESDVLPECSDDEQQECNNVELPEIVYGLHGKPYLAGNPCYFNISHSGEYLLFVQGEYEVGADLQVMRPCNMESVAKKAFTAAERQWVKEAFSEEEKTRRFYSIWCRKEAYGKYLGCGLCEEIFTKNTLDLLDTIDFLEYDILEGYCMCICCKKEEEREETVHLLEGL